VMSTIARVPNCRPCRRRLSAVGILDANMVLQSADSLSA
jgi:hypothetical protein